MLMPKFGVLPLRTASLQASRFWAPVFQKVRQSEKYWSTTSLSPLSSSSFARVILGPNEFSWGEPSIWTDSSRCSLALSTSPCRIASRPNVVWPLDGVALVPVFRMLRRRGQQLVGVCRGLFGGAGIQSGLRQAIQGVETPYRIAASDILFPIGEHLLGRPGHLVRELRQSVVRRPLL